jgi:hypothetical protein
MARINVSISDDLKRRMDEVDDESVNWSALASQAFEAKLAELITKRGAKTMRDVIARMRALKGTGGIGDRSRGREAGRNWAMNSADPRQLERLDELINGVDEDYFAHDPEQKYPPTARFYYEVVEPDHVGRPRSVLDWWSKNLEGVGEELPPASDVQGFVEGAMEVWEQVRDEL